MKTDTVFDSVILQAKQFIYKCRLDKCLPILSCFLQQLTLQYKIDEYNAKTSGELSTFNLNWLCYKPILTIETDNLSVYVVILDLECIHVWHAVNHPMCKANICLWSTVSVSMAVYMSVPFCLLSMYNLYMYICIIMYVIHCWNRYTDMFYNCVIFVILNKRKRKNNQTLRLYQGEIYIYIYICCLQPVLCCFRQPVPFVCLCSMCM